MCVCARARACVWCTVVNIMVIESAKPFFSTAAVIFPMPEAQINTRRQPHPDKIDEREGGPLLPSSRAAIMPATIRLCRPTEHVSPGLSIPGPHPCSQNKTSVRPSNSHFFPQQFKEHIAN